MALSSCGLASPKVCAAVPPFRRTNVNPYDSFFVGLDAFWPLNNKLGPNSTAKDFGPFQNHGTAQGGLVIGGGTDQGGRNGNATVFPGASGKYIRLNNSSSLDRCAISGKLTLAMWVLTTNNALAFQSLISGGFGAANFLPYDWYIKAGKLYFQIYNGGFGSFTGTAVLSNNTWYQVMAEYDNATCTFYINAVQDSSGAINKVMGLSPYAFKAIGSDASGGNPLAGKASQAYIWNRLLNNSERNILYMLGVQSKSFFQ